VSEARRFRFRPRYRGVAAVAMGVGAVTAAVSAVWGGFLVFPIVVGGSGLALGGAYLASPTWRYEVVVDDIGLAVVAGARDKLRVAWADIVRVVASPSTQTCFVDGGEPAKNLLVPGDGAPAPYAIEDRAALYAAILARVPPDRVEEVESLEAVMREPPRPKPAKKKR
jgi:hypothetical protein